MANIVKVNTYVTDIRHRADYAAIREEFFGKKMPASTMVAVAALAQPEFLIEIEAVAVLIPPQVRLKQRVAFSQKSLRRISCPRLDHSRILSIEWGNQDS